MTNCMLCNSLIVSTSVILTTDGVVVGIPSGSYFNGHKYCLVIAQPIPTTATIATPVLVQIGTATETYNLVNCKGQNVTACEIKNRIKYPVIVETTAESGVFKLLGNACKCLGTSISALEG